MPSTRTLVSGRDFQLRYVLHRLVQLARGIDPLHDRIERVRLEWPVASGRTTIDVDAVFEDRSGNIVEIVECREHLGQLPLDSVQSFLDAVKRLRKPGRRFRFVSPARFLTDASDFADAAMRAEKLGAVPRNITWELDAPAKESLTALCIALFPGVADPHALYARLYSRLAAQMSARLTGERAELAPLVRDPHHYLFNDTDPHRRTFDARGDAEQSFEIAELRNELERARSPRAKAFAASRDQLEQIRTRGIFGESSVTIEQIFVEPDASPAWLHSDRGKTGGRVEETRPALQILRATLGSDRGLFPVLVLAPFGFGKTTLLETFATHLLDDGSGTLPLLVRMRELMAAGTEIALLAVLETHIRTRYGIELSSYDGEICLLCDGFDELNLFYVHDERQYWVESSYRQLASLAQRRNITVVISGRPILFLGTSAAWRDGVTRVALQPFTDEQIERWCEKYRVSAGLDTVLSLAFLSDRNLVEVVRTPIVLYMIARIVETEPEILERKRYTKAEIYRLFIHWTERGGYRGDARKHALPENYREILQDIAWHLFQSSSGMLTDLELVAKLRAKYGRKVAGEVPVGRNLLVAHMLTTRNSDVARMIEFTHQSFREYLVAERIWRLLEPARQGKGLSAETWISLGDRLLTEAKVELLIEMVNAMPPQEAAALYAALDDTDNVHAYWSKWCHPVWEAVEHREKSLEEARAFFATLGSRAIALSVLSVILKVKLSRRFRPAGDSLDGDRLRVLLAFLDTYPDLGTGAAGRTLLLGKLAGLRLKNTYDFSLALFHDPDFSDSEIENIYFDQTRISDWTVVNSRFVDCRFLRAQIGTRRMESVTFENCDFASTSFDVRLCEQVTFRNCDFSNAFLSGKFADVTFVDCLWDGAYVDDCELFRVTLDRATHRFFKASGATLRYVTLVPRSDYHPARRPKPRRT